MAIRLMIDSAADITQSEAKELGVTMVPMSISFGSEEYLDGIDLTPESFFEKLTASAELPKTSRVAPYRIEEALDSLTQEGDEVIFLCISSKLSATYDGAKALEEKYGGKVRVVDSNTVSIGERLLLQFALQLVAEGKSTREIVEKIDEAKQRVHLIALMSTLEYLKKGGRIPAAVAIAGELLNVRPVIAIENGKVKLLGKALGPRKGSKLLTKLVEEKGIDFSLPYGAIYSGSDKTLLESYIRDNSALWEANADSLPIVPLGGTVGTHIGPDAIGVAFFGKI